MLFSPSASLPLPVKSSDLRHFGNITSGVSPLCIADIFKKHAGMTVVVTDTSAHANYLNEILPFLIDKELHDLVHLLPDWETLPYDSFSPHEDITSQRLETLYQLSRVDKGLLIIPVNSLLSRLCPRDFLEQSSFIIKIGTLIDINQYRMQLQSAGYRATDTVYEHGEFAVRGAVIDLFPMGCDTPIRIELFDDQVESLRTFDVDTQRTLDIIDRIKVLPAHEFPWTNASRQYFKDAWMTEFNAQPSQSPMLQDIATQVMPSGLEYFLPLFFESTSTLFDYLPENSLVVSSDNLQGHSDQFQQEISQRYESLRHDIRRPILPPHKLYMTTDELFRNIKQYPAIRFHQESIQESAGKINIPAVPLPDIRINSHSDHPIEKFEDFLIEFNNLIVLCAESKGRKEAIKDLLVRKNIQVIDIESLDQFSINRDHNLYITVAPIEAGCWFKEDQIAIISETELYGQSPIRQSRKKRSQDSTDFIVKNLTELQSGAPVVHIDHGVGRYRGLQTIDIDGQTEEFVTLEYAQEAKLYVPVSSLHLISRYSGVDESLAPLHKLGTEKWSTAKRKALEKIRDTATELLEIYARRAAKKGHAYPSPNQDYRDFCQGFPYEETPDQEAAIQDVIKDMTSPQPMDRLICGDVGFGKTEVAMRAAFMACHSERQVVVLVPTTLLAQQHYESFCDRFADTPYKIEILSRFKSAAEQKKAISALEKGTSDIVIGTHKLIQQKINFKNLGLLIIDEEHRFGVQQKEKIKALRSQIDILTLTATPIPRTLNMAMGGIRNLSIISTPPERRLSVKTFVQETNEQIIKEAIYREILRGGQVYFLHNEVNNIDKRAQEISELVSEARVTVAHGQMRERELERVMSDFYHKRQNVLVCTTIIETGIDIPNANTIIIDRADKFGLAQLHQLRGRVGRSHHQAYAYLLTPDHKKITKDADKRLEAIQAAQDLGAGFMLATHDLEIRGAGELLGDEQSGQIQSIGFNLYMELLDQTIKSMKSGKAINLNNPLSQNIEINLRIPAIIPEEYIPDVHNRLILYKRISNCENAIALKDLQVEMIDRFGLLPDPLKNLIRQTELKYLADRLGICKIEGGVTTAKIEFSNDTQVDPMRLITLIQTQPLKYKLEGSHIFKINLEKSDSNAKLDELFDLIKSLSKRA
jgi:transcription-repair coupling factor (superfamily II helicase)